jgi:DNA-binding transcriptional regulator LsrR (DeoR family)
MNQRDELLATVASLYYEVNISQSDIAARLDVSSSTVSRLLKEAHQKGIVEIRIRAPTPRDFELEQQLVKHFGLKDAYVLKTSPDQANENLLSAIGRLAASCMGRVIEALPAGSSIGVAWGTGVHAAVSALPDHYAQNIDVVQLLGGVGALAIDSPDLARMVAQKLGGRHYDLHAPVLVERPESREVLMNESAFREAILRARSVDVAITGIGTVQDEASSFLRTGLLSRSDLSRLRSEGIVGEVCGRFFDIEGRCNNFEINRRIIGIDLEDLRRIPQSIAIAHGLLKVEAVLGALRGHYMKVLSTDDRMARALLDLAGAR